MERAGEIDRDDGIPALAREIGDGCDVLDARVIDQDVQPAKFRLHPPHHGGDRGGLADIGTVIQHAHAMLGRKLGPLPLDSSPGRRIRSS